MANRLQDLYASMQNQLAANLDAARKANKNPNAKGDESELTWLKLFDDHLPHRYRPVKGIVIDSNGDESDAIDIIVYDPHCTPIIYNQQGYPYIPAESVYAVLESKQDLDKELVEYAGRKAESVRKLKWTSGSITAITGMHKPREPFRILAGIVAYESTWKPPFGDSFFGAISGLSDLQQLDFGIAAAHGCFEVNHEKKEIKTYPAERALSAFLIRFLARLQALGTVPAIDYDVYGRLLE
ncbi:MAG: DUF6602 domain-containing protein [Acidobacteriota bacterium]